MKISLRTLLCMALLTGFCNISSAQRLDGLYRSFNVVRMYPGAYPAKAYLFYPNGEVYKGIPPAESAGKFDFARAKRETPALCGTYTISNGRINFLWADGKTDNSYFNYRVRDGREEIDFNSTFWVKLITGDKQLNGEYQSSELDLGFPDSKNSGFPNFAKASELIIAFTTDGKFTVKHRSSTDAGSYVVKGAILKLYLSDGSTRDCTLHVFADSPKETRHEILYINGRPYILKSLL